MSRLTVIRNAVQCMMVMLVIASAVALLYSACLFVFNPLARLQAGLARVGEGDLSARIEAAADDEFGALSASFNHMAQTLQGLCQTLVTKVQEKTLQLDAQHARLAALYEAAAFASRATTLDELAQGFARQARRVARADAAAVRWSDESNRRYLMLASDCLPQSLVAQEQCLATGDCLCGQAQRQAATRVIPIRQSGPEGADGLLGHCRQAGYETVVSVPVRLHGRLVGELNLFYRHAATLSADDRALLGTLASHLAGAIEALRGGALVREAAVAEECGLLACERHDSIAQCLAFLKIQAGLLRQAVRRRDAALVDRTLDELDAGVHKGLSDVRDLLHLRTFTNAEARGHLLKTMDSEGLAPAIVCRVPGESMASAEVTSKLVNAFQSLHGDAVPRTPAEPASVADTFHSLSPREQQILAEISRGTSNKAIALALDIAEATVAIHVEHILRKLNLAARVQAALYAAGRPGVSL